MQYIFLDSRYFWLELAWLVANCKGKTLLAIEFFFTFFRHCTVTFQYWCSVSKAKHDRVFSAALLNISPKVNNKFWLPAHSYFVIKDQTYLLHSLVSVGHAKNADPAVEKTLSVALPRGFQYTKSWVFSCSNDFDLLRQTSEIEMVNIKMDHTLNFKILKKSMLSELSISKDVLDPFYAKNLQLLHFFHGQKSH